MKRLSPPAPRGARVQGGKAQRPEAENRKSLAGGAIRFAVPGLFLVPCAESSKPRKGRESSSRPALPEGYYGLPLGLHGHDLAQAEL